MKKMVITCAVVLAAVLCSCSDTERCFTVTVKAEVGSLNYEQTYNFWGTRDALNAFEEKMSAVAELTPGIEKKDIKISAVANGKAQSDCK